MTAAATTPTAADANEALLESWSYSLHNKQSRTKRHYVDEAQRFAAWLAGIGRRPRHRMT